MQGQGVRVDVKHLVANVSFSTLARGMTGVSAICSSRLADSLGIESLFFDIQLAGCHELKT